MPAPPSDGLPDRLIAAIAIRNGARLLHQDADFDVIARHAPPQTLALGW